VGKVKHCDADTKNDIDPTRIAKQKPQTSKAEVCAAPQGAA